MRSDRERDDAPITDEYSETDYNYSDSDAHRSTEYNIPSSAKQVWINYQTQLKLYGKGRIIWMVLLFVLAIPIVIYSGYFDKLISNLLKDYIYDPGSYLMILLIALPMMAGLIVPSVMSKSLNSEFRLRTAHMNLAMPQSRFSFFLAKFLAGITVVMMTFLLVYGVSLLIVNSKYDGLYLESAGSAAVLMVAGLLAYSATAFTIGSFLKKGGTFLLFALWVMLLPAMMTGIALKFDGVVDIMGYLPFYSNEYTLVFVGESFVSHLVDTDFSPYLPDVGIAALISIIWAVAFFALGYYFFKRRQA